jgi:hypothetical protein
MSIHCDLAHTASWYMAMHRIDKRTTPTANKAHTVSMSLGHTGEVAINYQASFLNMIAMLALYLGQLLHELVLEIDVQSQATISMIAQEHISLSSTIAISPFLALYQASGSTPDT